MKLTEEQVKEQYGGYSLGFSQYYALYDTAMFTRELPGGTIITAHIYGTSFKHHRPLCVGTTYHLAAQWTQLEIRSSKVNGHVLFQLMTDEEFEALLSERLERKQNQANVQMRCACGNVLVVPVDLTSLPTVADPGRATCSCGQESLYWYVEHKERLCLTHGIMLDTSGLSDEARESLEEQLERINRSGGTITAVEGSTVDVKPEIGCCRKCGKPLTDYGTNYCLDCLVRGPGV